MHSFTSICLSALLIVGLIPVPAMAAPATASMGVVLHADRAKVGNSQAVSGATVFDGDRLETDPAGQLRVRLGTSQAHLYPRSSAVVRQSAGGFEADLTAGSMVLSGADGETFSLTANGAMVRPGSSQATVADFFLEKDPLFARLNLDDEELALYLQIYQHLQLRVSPPDLVISDAEVDLVCAHRQESVALFRVRGDTCRH